MKKLLLIIFMALLAQNAIASEKIIVSSWLKTEAMPVTLPAFHNIPNIQGEDFSDNQLLSFEQLKLDDYFPERGKRLMWLNDEKTFWEESFSDEKGFIEVVDSGMQINNYKIAYMAVYIEASRWIETSLEIKSPQMLTAYINGERIGTKTTVEKGENQIGTVSQNLELNKGKHLLIIKSLFSPVKNDSIADWRISASFEIDEPYTLTSISTSLLPENIKNINHIMDGVKISGTSLSHDAKYYIVNYRESLPPSNNSRSWAEIKTTDDRKKIHSFRNASVSNFVWLPKSNRISYISRTQGKATLYLHDIENNEIDVLLEDIEDFTTYRWSPDEKYIIYYKREEGPSGDDDINKLYVLRDRIPGYRNRIFLYKYDVESGIQSRMTFGNLTSSILDISPDGKSILLSQTRHEYDEKPYSKQDLYILNANDFTIDTLFYGKNWSISARFSPDGKKLLAVGGPSAFDGKGENVPEGMIPNNYDSQMYIISLEDKSINPITKHFDPSVISAHWSKADNNIYFTATERDYRNLYMYNVRRERFSLMETGADIVNSFRISSGSSKAVYYGNKTNSPPKAYLINLRNGRYNVLEDTESHNYRFVRFGEVNDWNFTTDKGVEISGRMYLPHDFDENAKYPVIVYYYAGTTPVTRSFGGRYPFNLWAANGYLVYVMQPSGSIGFGQEFSAAHVNNWGKTVADEIIEGTKKFLDAHPFADRENVGCVGASYGGFMTMLLITRTDIFKTAISHAGISSISSYWGEGYWGYGYSAIASAGSFPWNNKDLYVGQSPLFHADKINTPLLLLTGDEDTNVPPGESIQMFTALTLLGKPVELVLIKGENHHIVTYNKRIKWHNTIMAWWDKMLKNQPEYWENLFPEKNL